MFLIGIGVQIYVISDHAAEPPLKAVEISLTGSNGRFQDKHVHRGEPRQYVLITTFEPLIDFAANPQGL